MKEILKYLRTVNSYSQQNVADAIGLSRQSYNKYEAGTVIPSDKIVKKLADFYNVEFGFIKANKIPSLPGKENTAIYSKKSSNYGSKYVESPSPAYCATTVAPAITKTTDAESPKIHEAYYSHGHIIPNYDDLNLKEGQRLHITIQAESEEEEQARREKAWETLQSLAGKFKLPPELENLSYDELRTIALEEKYGPF